MMNLSEHNFKQILSIIRSSSMDILKEAFDSKSVDKILSIIIKYQDKFDKEGHIDSIFIITKICGQTNGNLWIMNNIKIFEYLKKIINIDEIADYVAKIIIMLLRNCDFMIYA